MAYPTTKTNAQDNTTEIVAAHLNQIEDYLGVTGSADSASITYKLSNTTGGHDHDGSDSKKVLATNLDITGISALKLLRVNTGGTAVEGLTGPTGALVGESDTQTLTNKTLTSPVINTGISGTAFLDEDDMTSNSATKVASQQSIKAYVDSKFAAAWPVGSIFISVVSTNPATLLGFGTWTAFATGRTLVGIDAGQTEFDTVEETGGSKTHTLTTDEIPAHTHTVTGNNVGGSGGVRIDASDSFTDTTSSTGGGGAHNNLQPYIVTYMWKRTA